MNLEPFRRPRGNPLVDRRRFLTQLAGWSAVAPTLLPFAPIRPTIVRGPYLQCGTSHSIIVRWRTDYPTTGQVHYGTAPDQLRHIAGHTAHTTEHLVRLANLTPDTRYYYRIVSEGIALTNNIIDHTFVTSPLAGQAKPTRVWVIGDSGLGNHHARAVRDAFAAYAKLRAPDLWLMLGDNAYPNSTDAEYQRGLFDVYGKLLRSSVVWPTYGNHDSYCVDCDAARQRGPYFDIFSPPTQAEAGGVPSNTKAYYAFDYGNVHFIALDSMDSSRAVDGPMLRWLERDLAATRQAWIIAFWHHPPYSWGVHNSDTTTGEEVRMMEMRTNVVPILERHNVDLVLCGHNHMYERSVLLYGHYGFSSELAPSMILNHGDGCPAGDGCYRKASHGTVYAVVGSSSHLRPSTQHHPVMVRNINRLGSLVLDIDGRRLDARFIDDRGAVRDHFTIQKREPHRLYLPRLQAS